MNYQRLFVILTSCLLFALACRIPATVAPTQMPIGMIDTMVAQALTTAAGSPEATQEPSTTPSTTPSPFPTPTICAPEAAWVMDVTIPDNTELAPNTPFTKTWRMRNSGACPWEVGTKLLFISGDLMSGPAAVDAPPIAPGAQTDISVPMIAPSTAGTYRGQWQLQSPNGTHFGPIIWVQIIVPAPVLPSDTPVPVIDLYPFNISLQDWTPRVGQDIIVSLTLRNGGNIPVANFTVRLIRQSPGNSCPGAGTIIFDDNTSLDANGSQVFRRTIRFTTAGTYQLCVILDHLNRINESNEDNNALRSNQNVTVTP